MIGLATPLFRQKDLSGRDLLTPNRPLGLIRLHDLTQECIVFDQDQQISVQFLQEIEVEEKISLTITTKTDAKIKKMWVQGVNMYMGKNAVLVDSMYAKEMKKVYNAHLFLGSCSEPEMRWQLIVQTTDNNELEQSWFFNFSTDRNKKN